MTQVVVPPGPVLPVGGLIEPGTTLTQAPHFLPAGQIVEQWMHSPHPPTTLDEYYRWVTIVNAGHGSAFPLPGGHDFGSCCWNSLTKAYYNPYWGVDPPVNHDHKDGDLGNSGGPWAEGFVLPKGFRLGINLLASPGSGDFMPPSPNIGGSALPLLPAGSAGLSTGWQGRTRPTLHGVIDLITGLPMVQVTDLQLPFGSATFRLTRTRSGNHWLDDMETMIGMPSTSDYQPVAQDRWWDWVGTGWMIGENPLLLIDSALPDVVGPYPRVTWLVLDAHHSIPFQQVNLADGRLGYEAPPRFRARMKHNGVWGMIDGPDRDPDPPAAPVPDMYGWRVPPTQYEVWLYDGLVKYTFVAVRDDVPPKRYNRDYPSSPSLPGAWTTTSYHDIANYNTEDPEHTPYDSDNNPGFGVPYYGLCTRIEDRNGQFVEIAYCSGQREQLDDPATTCVECQQVCLRKGMISRITLKTRGAEADTTHWTLLYTYRYLKGDFQIAGTPGSGAWPFMAPVDDDTEALIGSAVIDSIYVYRGDRAAITAPTGASSVCVTLPWTDYPYAAGAQEPLAYYNSRNPNAPIPVDWTHRARYFYRTVDWDPAAPNTARPLVVPPILRNSIVTTRRESGPEALAPGSERHRYTFYRYGNGEGATLLESPGDDEINIPWLERIYSHDDYARMVAWGERRRADPVEDPDEMAVAQWLNNMTPEKFATIDHVVSGGSGEPTDIQQRHRLFQFASTWLRPQTVTQWHTSETGAMPKPQAIKQTYVKSPANGALAYEDNLSAVAVATLGMGDGQVRHYRIHRLMGLPANLGLSSPGPTFYLGGVLDLPGNMSPNRSLLFHPYRWFTVREDEGSAYRTPDLKKARWYAVIDEFADGEIMRDEWVLYGSDDYSIKPGQISRRVVEMNAAGYVLKDKTWEFRDGQVSVTGGGLGEEYEYRRIEEVFPSAKTDLLALVAAEVPLPPGTTPDESKLRQIDAFLKQLLLVEHRSVGWSAAHMAGQPNQTNPVNENNSGLISFYVYDWYGIGSSAPADTPWQARVQLMGEGVRKGKGGQMLFTRQLFRAAQSPTDVLGEVEFLTAAAGAVNGGSTANDPEYSPPPRPVADLGTAKNDPGRDAKYKITEWVTEHEAASGEDPLPITERRVTRRGTIGPRRQLYPGSSWFYPVEMELYGADDGTPSWSATGLVLNPQEPTSPPNPPPVAPSDVDLQTLILTYTNYYQGRIWYSVADVEPGAGPFESPTPQEEQLTIPEATTLPEGWRQRFGGTTDPLEYLTYYLHDDEGPTDIYFPNGRRFARRKCYIYAPTEGSPPLVPGQPDSLRAEPGANPSSDWSRQALNATPFARVFVFNDLEPIGDAQSVNTAWVARSPGEVRDYDDLDTRTIPTRTRKVEFTAQSGPGAPETPAAIPAQFLSVAAQADQPFFRMVVEKILRPDQYGRMTDADLFEANVDNVPVPLGFKQVNDLGEVYREREMDGTITRIIRNHLGQNLRKYVGTIDDAWLTTIGTNIQQGANNNLVLVERTDYGKDPNDCWMPTVIRRYTTNQGFAGNWHEQPWDNPPPEDPYGQATVTGYDWRMRSVRIDSYATGNPNATNAPGTPGARLQTTVTYLDHAGRARMVATYGPGTTLSLGGSLDPTLFPPNPAVEIPSAYDVLNGSGLRPLSLVAMAYGADGNLTERREYDVSSTANPPDCHIEFQYTGMGGNVVYRQRPGEGIERTTLDGLARVSRTATVVPRHIAGVVDYELEAARTDYDYDADNNVLFTTRWERVVGANSTTPTPVKLDATNAVWSRTFNWHDVNKRLVATAELGTSETDGARYVVSGPPPVPGWFNASLPQEQWPRIDPVASSVSRGPVPLGVPLSLYHFDRRGNQDYVASPSGAVTKFEYTGTGKVARKTENCFEFGGTPARKTEYEYRFGRLSAVEADRVDGVDPEGQRTWLLFGANEANGGGADVIDTASSLSGGDRAVSKHGGHVRSMHLAAAGPESPGLPADEIRLRYDFLGRLAERVDARGVVLRYTYDDLDRLVATEVGHYTTTGTPPNTTTSFNAGYPSSMNLGPGEPAERIGYVQYLYTDPDMKTFEVKAWDNKTASLPTGAIPIAHTKMEFDDRGQLIADWQAMGALITSETEKTSYTWDVQFSEADGWPVGRSRLAAMTYPNPPGYGPPYARTVTMGYGGAGLPDDMLGRLAVMTTAPSGGAQGPSQVAAFQYVGTGRRARMTLANGAIVQDLGLDDLPAGGIGLAGLDRFGRVADLHWRQGPVPASGQAWTGSSLTRVEYTYDSEGNRTGATRTPRPTGGAVAGTYESQINAYDRLNRLTDCDVNHHESGAPTLIRDDHWNLDLLGNWGQRVMNSDIAPDAVDEHAVNHRNEIDTWTRTVNGGSPQAIDVRYDAGRNLLFDGAYAFQFDAWNRLLQINEASLGAPVGSPPVAPVVLGDLVKHYTYDGLGRLIRVQSPYPASGYGEVRSERLFYDGIRRIQEVIIDPVDDTEDAAMAGDPAAMEAMAANPDLDGDVATLETENSQVTAASGGGGGGASPPGVTLEREYIWGPGDNGVDELLVQYDRNRAPWWVLQDAGLDAIALCDLGGSGGAARVVWQATYDAYGSVLTAEQLYPHAYLRAGHKGLFFDRLDVGVMNPSSGLEEKRLEPGAEFIGQVRNRAYSPDLGRFVQRDPNATASMLIASLPCGGNALTASLGSFDLSCLYGDGANLYQYSASSPWVLADPIGLFSALAMSMYEGTTNGRWDPFDMVDDYIATDAASKAAFLNRIVGPVHTAAYVVSYLASYIPHAAGIASGYVNSLMNEPASLRHSDMWGTITDGLAQLDTMARALVDQFHLAYFDTLLAYNPGSGHAQQAGLSAGAITLTGLVAAGGQTHHVYAGVDNNGNIVYFGVTGDVNARKRQHGARFTLMQITTRPVSILQALAIETALIEMHRGPHLQNRMRSISPRRAMFGLAMSWALGWIQKNAPQYFK